MNYLQIDKASISNGPGVRVVLWVAGCSLHCKGCQNPESWDFNSGKLFDENVKQELFDALNKPYIQGVTFSGGHPLEKENRFVILDLIKEIKFKFPEKNIWLYTGYTFEEICEMYCNERIYNFLAQKKLKTDANWDNLQYVDVIVDGAYVEEQRDLTLKFCGSNNQRIIDMKKSLEKSEIVLWVNNEVI